MSNIEKPIVVIDPAVVLIATTQFYRVACEQSIISTLQVIWNDAVSAFPVTLFTSNRENPAADLSVPENWFDESAAVPWVGAPGGAVGTELKHIGNNGARWYLLRIGPTTAASNYSILFDAKE